MPQVLAGGLASARVSDLCSCLVGSGPISQGAAMVLVGGLPAARLGDATIHGGAVALGHPLVLIGGPVFSVPASIKIEGDATFQSKVVRDLYLIWRTPTGKGLLESIDKSGKTVTIKPAAAGEGNSTGYDNPSDRFYKPSGTPGNGTNATIEYDPDRTRIGSEPWETRPPAIGLAHELVHADHAVHGTMSQGFTNNDNKPDPTNPNVIEQEKVREVEAAGIPPNNNRPFHENKIRSEWDPPQPQRQWY
jgi:type VI secretion system secreted protein VgrG